MRMPAVFITALSTLLLVYADLQSWSAFAIIAVVCVSAAAVGLSAPKYSQYAAAWVAASVIACDAFSRHAEATISALHNSVTLGDFSYAVCLFATAGWIGGWLLRRKHDMPGKMQIFDPPRPTAMISPAFSRRRLPRTSA